MPHHLPDNLRKQKVYSEDLQQRVIYQRYTCCKAIHDISIDLDVSCWVVERILKLWCDTGEVIPLDKGVKKRRRRIMTDGEIEASHVTILLSNLHYNHSCSSFSGWQSGTLTYTWMKCRTSCTHSIELSWVYQQSGTHWPNLAWVESVYVCYSYPNFSTLTRYVALKDGHGMQWTCPGMIFALKLGQRHPNSLFSLMKVGWMLGQHTSSMDGHWKVNMPTCLLNLYMDKGMCSSYLCNNYVANRW